MTPLVLASTSPARAALLRQVGASFIAIDPGVDESGFRDQPPLAQARALAEAKAGAAARTFAEAIVIGADQVLDLDGKALGKPASPDEAREQLSRLAGRTHALVTGICILHPGGAIVDAETTHLTVRDLSPAEIDAYVATGEWHGCAGGYRLEGRGLVLFERVEGDPSNVVGLPVPRLFGHLRRLGVPLFP